MSDDTSGETEAGEAQDKGKGKKVKIRTEGLTAGNVFDRFSAGFSLPFKGIRYLFKHKSLLKYALPPVIVTTTLMIASWIIGFSFTDTVVEWIWMPTGEAWYDVWLLKPLWWILYVVTLLIVLTVSTVLSYLASLPVAGPLFEMLSEKVEAIETGFDAPFDLMVMARNMLTTLLHVSAFLMLQLLVFGVIFLVQLIPVAGQVIGALLGTLTGPLLVGFVPFDYPSTIRLWTFREKLAFMFRNFALFFGFALASAVLLYLPVINLLFLPGCVVAATLAVIAMEKSGELTYRDRRKEILRKRGVDVGDSPAEGAVEGVSLPPASETLADAELSSAQAQVEEAVGSESNPS
jgi:uncharacterized protein involved in cysteine biosynthesis